ncbi:MAG: dihydrofolate reductase [Erysipelotrichaceae bacterium]|nr:dihydrofolate reductase [Erysipelotrichaceae bacterium]
MISFSVALDPNKGIGYKGALPWHLKDELKLFKQNTLFKNIVMGQTTFDGLPRKLEDRYITVISLDPEYRVEGVSVVNDLIAFLEEHKEDETEYIICGGASIYRQSYPYCSKAYVSFVKEEYETDTKFDAFDLNDWDIVKEEDHPDFIYRELIRKKAE